MPDIFDASEIAYTCVTAEKVKINRISLITLHFAAFPAIRSPRRETELKDRARSACMRHLLFAEINLFGCQKICGHVVCPCRPQVKLWKVSMRKALAYPSEMKE
jgi:hypothetical protein